MRECRRQEGTAMTTFLLLHGAYRAEWHFRLLAYELEAPSHRVVTPHLPTDDPDAGAERYAEIATAVPRPTTKNSHSV